MNRVSKLLGFLILPVVLTVSAYILFANAAKLSQPLISALQYISYVLFLIGMILGLRFNKSKVFFLCLILALSQFMLIKGSFLLPSSKADSSGILAIVSLLIPVNIFLFSIFKERGVFTLWGNLKFAFLGSQAFVIAAFLDPKNQKIKDLAAYKPVNLEVMDRLPVPQLAFILFFLTLLFLAIRLYLKPTLMDSSLVGVIALTYLALAFDQSPLSINIFYAAAGLTMVISVVETSYFMAYRDELTGIPARRALKEAMLKLGGKYSIAMIDIDFFKKFNDTHGHDAGDEVLRMVASNLSRVTGGGRAFRFGGEEFTILFPGKSKNEAFSHLDELRAEIAKQKFTYTNKKTSKGKAVTKQLGVTISIGVAEKNEKLKTSEEVLQAADKNLYKAKKNGRNCVCK